MKVLLSIILPTFNECRSSILPKILDSFASLQNFELIVVDSESEDSTLDLIKSHKIFIDHPRYLKIISTSSKKRGEKLNLGLQSSEGEIILLHHPRSFLEIDGITKLFYLSQTTQWGAFTHLFDRDHPFLRFTSFYSNNIRGRLKSIYYLDHCIFARRSQLMEVGIPEVEIFEDTLLSIRLAKISKPLLLPNKSTTSSIRFEKNGIIFQSILNQFMKIGYFLKIPFPILNQFYERSLELNSKYR